MWNIAPEEGESHAKGLHGLGINQNQGPPPKYTAGKVIWDRYPQTSCHCLVTLPIPTANPHGLAGVAQMPASLSSKPSTARQCPSDPLPALRLAQPWSSLNKDLQGSLTPASSFTPATQGSYPIWALTFGEQSLGLPIARETQGCDYTHSSRALLDRHQVTGDSTGWVIMGTEDAQWEK